MEILGITLARGGSKRVPRKNVRRLNEKPLLYYTVMASKEAKMLTRYVISSEDHEIKKLAEGYGVEIIDRPIELARDNSATIPVLKHTIGHLWEQERYSPDIVVQLNATSPLRTSQDIDNAVKMLIETRCDAVKSVVQTMRIDRIHRLDDKGRVEFCWPYREIEMGLTRTQECPTYYVGNGAITVTWTRCLDAGDSWKEVFYDQDIDFRGYVMPPERSVDIDTEHDFRLAEVTLEITKGALHRDKVTRLSEARGNLLKARL